MIDERIALLTPENRAEHARLLSLSRDYEEESDRLEREARDVAERSRFAWSTANRMLQEVEAEAEEIWRRWRCRHADSRACQSVRGYSDRRTMAVHKNGNVTGPYRMAEEG